MSKTAEPNATIGEISSYVKLFSQGTNTLHQLAGMLEQHLERIRGDESCTTCDAAAPDELNPPIISQMKALEGDQQRVISRMAAAIDELTGLL